MLLFICRWEGFVLVLCTLYNFCTGLHLLESGVKGHQREHWFCSRFCADLNKYIFPSTMSTLLSSTLTLCQAIIPVSPFSSVRSHLEARSRGPWVPAPLTWCHREHQDVYDLCLETLKRNIIQREQILPLSTSVELFSLLHSLKPSGSICDVCLCWTLRRSLEASFMFSYRLTDFNNWHTTSSV